MCGIAGVFDLASRGRARANVIEAMTAVIAHRGPDECAYLVDADVAFGFQRLAIVDPQGGHQPMWNEDQSVFCICNGEIYNHLELRRRLEKKGHQIASRCDVAVLPHLYEEYGENMTKELDGQFGFAIFDRRTRTLIAARDHFGVVPFFYAHVAGLFLFASEIKSLLAHPAVSRKVDLTGLDQILCFPGLISPTTMFADIKSLPSGHQLSVSSKGVEEREYWDLEFPLEAELPPRRDDVYYIDSVRELLGQSVRKRLMSDVPLGLYLSGGLDSSLVSALVCQGDSASPRHSFGVSFHGEDMCEQRYQHCVSRHLNTTHHDVPFRPADLAREFPKTIYHAECPVKESYDATCLGLSREAKRSGVSVVLTGQGADELFAGYIGYRFDAFYSRRSDCNPQDAVEQAVRHQMWGDRAFGYDRNYSALLDLKKRLYSPDIAGELSAFDCFQRSALPKDRVAGRHILHKRSYLDFKLRLADHLLADHGDRMAMANSVEVRHPFLDLDLVQFVSSIPPELMLRDQTEKYILRQIAQPLIPRAVVHREKFGWFAHGSPELLRNGGEYFRELVSPERLKRQGYFNPATVGSLVESYTAPGFTLNQPFESDILMLVLSFGAFLDTFQVPALN
jgi:asparagine synthase (glutamine-hydrolysing)